VPSPSRRTYAYLAVALIAFAAYASLVPFNLRPRPMAEAVVALDRLLSWEVLLGLRFSRTDLLANILLFVPVGFCLTGALRLHRTAWWSGPVATVVVAAIVVPVSLAIEFAQVFTADRIASPGDVAAQVLGAGIGLVVWEAAGPEVHTWLRAAHAAHTRAMRVERLLTAYAVLWAITNLAPFDMSIDIGDLAKRWRSGGIVVSLWASRPQPGVRQVWDAATALVTAIPLGVLAAVGWMRPGSRRGAIAALRLATLPIVGIEIAQVVIRSHTADTRDALLGVVGAGVGILIAASSSGTATPSSPAAGVTRWARWALLGCVVASGAYHWMPFDFTTDRATAASQVRRISLVPFAGYRSGSDLKALDQVLVKVGLGLAMGLAAGLSVRRPSAVADRRLTAVMVLAAAAGVLGLIELGQVFLPSRTPDPSDVLVGTLGAWVGWRLAWWVLPFRHLVPEKTGSRHV
jgi:VanZ family protein